MKRKTDVNDTNVVNINRRIFNNKTINMEQKFKVGDLVKSKSEDWTKGLIGKVLGYVGGYNAVEFEDLRKGHNCHGLLKDGSLGGWHLLDYQLELAYPSDHDLLDYAASDSKIAELTAENEALKAELEKYKPKLESMTIEIKLFRRNDGVLDWWIINEPYNPVIARKTVTITEGEGM